MKPSDGSYQRESCQYTVVASEFIAQSETLEVRLVDNELQQVWNVVNPENHRLFDVLCN